MADLRTIRATNPNVTLRDPATGQVIGVDGAQVDFDAKHPSDRSPLRVWWKRRIKDGDAEIVQDGPKQRRSRPALGTDQTPTANGKG